MNIWQMELYVKVFMASYTDQTTCSYQFNILSYVQYPVSLWTKCNQPICLFVQPCKCVCVGTQKALENPIDWKARLNIALNCAEGGEYLTSFLVKSLLQSIYIKGSSL
jgi:hypothetical protein